LQLLEMARAQHICCVTIKDLVQYRIAHEAPSSIALGVMLSGYGLDWTGITCVNGQKAAFSAIGEVSTRRPRVCVVHVHVRSLASSHPYATQCSQLSLFFSP
jgi:hypothetical protein